MAKRPKAFVRDAWGRIEAWCLREHPKLLTYLHPGASSDAIEEFEAAIGRPLPADVRESFAIHDGAEGIRLVLGLELLSIGQALFEWRDWLGSDYLNDESRGSQHSTPPDAIRLDYANAGWIPLTADAGGSHLGVDLAPGSTGVVGQVINFGRHERRKCVLATGWGEFLGAYAAFLEASRPEVDPDDVRWWPDQLYEVHGHPNPYVMLAEWRQTGRWPPR